MKKKIHNTPKTFSPFKQTEARIQRQTTTILLQSKIVWKSEKQDAERNKTTGNFHIHNLAVMETGRNGKGVKYTHTKSAHNKKSIEFLAMLKRFKAIHVVVLCMCVYVCVSERIFQVLFE